MSEGGGPQSADVIWYSVRGLEPRRSPIEWRGHLPRPREAQDAAETCAAVFWPVSEPEDWPLVFKLYLTENGPEVARYTVNFTWEPAFCATMMVP